MAPWAGPPGNWDTPGNGPSLPACCSSRPELGSLRTFLTSKPQSRRKPCVWRAEAALCQTWGSDWVCGYPSPSWALRGERDTAFLTTCCSFGPEQNKLVSTSSEHSPVSLEDSTANTTGSSPHGFPRSRAPSNGLTAGMGITWTPFSHRRRGWCPQFASVFRRLQQATSNTLLVIRTEVARCLCPG